ncbi:hypothetical protein VP01_7732g1 [Puccinia sorghi]|uniref:Reverse transcriptase Ty1/copia-type domain-containing protein n=1 Tax=Puccinia sorghi TaxID=27349 RepID=A0A0L6UBF9_9BASI|nr:hypothetical protein VP01_7732g1 [Puccinia sorghi]
MSTLEKHKVWENHWEEPPNLLNTTWVFKITDNTHGNPSKFKGRLCVQGFNPDYLEIYAPTGKVSTLRMILLYSLHANLNVVQFNVQGEFLHASLTEEVYIKTPKGVNRPLWYS